jgi:hypothetical protein
MSCAVLIACFKLQYLNQLSNIEHHKNSSILKQQSRLLEKTWKHWHSCINKFFNIKHVKIKIVKDFFEIKIFKRINHIFLMWKMVRIGSMLVPKYKKSKKPFFLRFKLFQIVPFTQAPWKTNFRDQLLFN